MHNLHLVVCEAENGKEACSLVEAQIESFGNENNWRTICGAVRSNGDNYSTGEGRWEPQTLEELKKSLTDVIFKNDGEKDHLSKMFLEVLAKMNDDAKLTGMDWYYVKKYAEQEGARCDTIQGYGGKDDLTPKAFDLFENEYFSWKLDEFGLTNIVNDDKAKKENLWVVLVDMHS